MLRSMNGCECVCVNFLNTDNFPASKPKLQISMTKTGVWCFRSFNFIGKIFNVIMKKRKLTFDGLPFLSHLNLPVFSNHHLESQNKNSKSNPDEEACHFSSAATRIISTILVSALLVVVGLYHICKACCKRGNDNYYYFYYYFLKNFKQLFKK